LGIPLVGLRPARFLGDGDVQLPVPLDFLPQVFQASSQQVASNLSPLLLVKDNLVAVCFGHCVDEPNQIFGQCIVRQRDAQDLTLLREIDPQVSLQPFDRIAFSGEDAETGDARITDRGVQHEVASQEGQLGLLEDVEILVLLIHIEGNRLLLIGNLEQCRGGR